MQTRSQKLAQRAINVVEGWENDWKKQQNQQKEYKELIQFARRFPTLVQTCGLLQAVAFVESKVENKKKTIYEEYVKGFKEVLAVLDSAVVEGDFKKKLSGSNAVEYMLVSRYALEAATWIKRYVSSANDSE